VLLLKTEVLILLLIAASSLFKASINRELASLRVHRLYCLKEQCLQTMSIAVISLFFCLNKRICGENEGRIDATCDDFLVWAKREARAMS
jgi:hypothetical protein